MKINELTEAGVGKITKQNTTVDVKPGETERQAAKLFPMNKGGKPQPLHTSAAKNSTPNKLFNLGLAENISVTGTERRRLERKKGLEIGSPEWFKHWFSLPYLNEGSEIFLEGYKLRLERGKDMDVLHIVDTNSGERTEVRGKPDYERAYDPLDPLHQLLDKIGKASNISDLINGEPVGINPKHPDGASAKAAADRAFNEDIDDRKQRMFLDAMLAAMHKLVQSKGDKQSLGSYAFSIANSFGYDPRALMNLYKDRYNVSEDVTAGELNALERVVDRAFAQVGIDVEFTKHFLDRANDKRNGEPITVKELAQLFSKEIRTWGKPIAQMGPDTEAVMKDLETDINIPFVLRWNGKELEMIAKTVMRKKNFRTSNKEFPVENAPGTLLHKINWGGQNKPQQPKQNTQQQPKAKPRNRFDKLVNWYKNLFNEAFVKPQFDVEWEEAERYPEFVKIGKEAWIELVSKGKAVTITDASDINNTDAADPNSFKLLDPAKQKRALAQLEKGSVEMPIVAVYSDGWKELIGGNTRLTAMMARDGRAIVWVFNVPDSILENFADGKVKGKSRPGRVKRAGASCDGSVSELRKKAKNSSGEKAKMYHWCANMKSGKQK